VEIAIIIAAVAVTYLIASLYFPMLSGGAGYSPTPRKDIVQALQMAGLRKEDVFYDLGCGTGTTLIEASKLCDHVNGVEIEPVRWLIAWIRARRARVVLGDLFSQDISDADIIFLFQYRGRINNRIAKKIMAETPSGTKVISYHHPLENMKLVKSQNDIFIYRTGRS